jgi:hypothetical protein
MTARDFTSEDAHRPEGERFVHADALEKALCIDMTNRLVEALLQQEAKA